MHRDRVEDACRRLERHLSDVRLRGFDPWEGLISPRARRLPRGVPQQAWIRACSMSGRRGAKFYGLRQLRMVKTVALVLLAKRLEPNLSFDGEALTAELQGCRNDDGGWGYEFDAQFRWGRYSAGASNAVVTAFVVEALAEAPQISDRLLQRYLSRDLVDPVGFFRYYAGSPVLIHNANMLLCRTAARLGLGDELVLRALNNSVRCRTAAGLWKYGNRPDLEWADIYHNAYIGWVLDDLAQLGLVDAEVARDATAAWLAHFFDVAGRPKMLSTDTKPTRNVNAIATALFWLCMMRNPPVSVESHIAGSLSALLEMQRSDGSFGGGELRFPRWNDAPALLALAVVTRRSRKSRLMGSPEMIHL